MPLLAGSPAPASARRADTLAWAGMGLLLALAAALGWGRDPALWEWQPALALQQPWRWFSPVAVHHSGAHLAANGLGLALVVVLGRRAGCGAAAALAWLAAWPLTHLGLWAAPSIQHYGGLSGVLHAGVAVIGLGLSAGGTGRTGRPQRRIGALLLAGLAAKLLWDAPWRGAVQVQAGTGLAVATAAHLSGALAGMVCMAAALGLQRARRLRQAGPAPG